MSTDAEAIPNSESPKSRLARFRARNDKIVAAACSGETLTSIGERYGMSRERVRQIALNGGFSRRDRSRARDSEICKAFQNGAYPNRVAMDFGLPVHVVYSVARKYGLSLKGRASFHAGTLKIIARLLRGDSHKDIAVDAHVLPVVIHQRASDCRAAGIPIPYEKPPCDKLPKDCGE